MLENCNLQEQQREKRKEQRGRNDQGEKRSVWQFKCQYFSIQIKYGKLITKWNYLCIKHKVKCSLIIRREFRQAHGIFINIYEEIFYDWLECWWKKMSSFHDLNLSEKKKLYIHISLFVTILLVFKHCWQNISHLWFQSCIYHHNQLF